MTLDAATWGALALTLTVLGCVYTYVAWRRRGFAAGLRGLAWTLVPPALWLSGTLKLAGNIASDVGSWAVHLVFSPIVWAGVATGAASVFLFAVSGVLLGRGIGVRRAGRRSREAEPKQVRATKARTSADDGTEDMDDIEAILRKHGIS